ncbi:MAG: 50S ribosomal protein L15 [Patescibacteria group bacterium]
MLSLNSIKKSQGANQKRKRVGRGNASGHGTYSTRGLKGQKSRSGVSGLKKLGMKKQLLKIPKLRGFKSVYPKNQIVSVKSINANFKDQELVSPETLLAKNIILDKALPVKILGKEKLLVKVKFAGVKMSQAVKGQLAQ